MKRSHVRRYLVGGALVIALAGAALGARVPDAEGPAPVSSVAPSQLAPYELAALLSQSPPDVVVIRLDDAVPPMHGSVPASALGADDAALVRSAPKARRIVIAGGDAVRADRLARQLSAAGRHVQVLEGGVAAWTQAMKQDPAAPSPGATPETWSKYRREVALRRYFGDEASAPPPVIEAPAPVMVAAPPARKREGC